MRTIAALLQILIGSGLTITDWDLLDDTLIECGYPDGLNTELPRYDG